MWRYLLADLHLHTVLSPCAEVEMIPPLIVQRARELGLEVIAVTDHNAMLNAPAVQEAAGASLTVLPGMEVMSREEVHLVCLFDHVSQAAELQERVWEALPPGENNEEYFGAQYVVDSTGAYLRTETRLLSAATTLSVDDVAMIVHGLGGIVVAAHVDRPWASLIANLGFVPRGLALAGLDLSRRASLEEVERRLPQTVGWGKVVSGDAHRLEEMTARTMLKVQEPTVAELALALKAMSGRRVQID
ncbi:MAG TPA: PHP domain-containing protein [Anaerolineae bacterium]|nr:PHP domain-containing protein [Anaerolineae bacterium]